MSERKAKEQLEKKLSKYGAELTPFMTTEKLVDKSGGVHYVEYAPIDWDKVKKGARQ